MREGAAGGGIDGRGTVSGMSPQDLLAEFVRQVRLTSADTTPGHRIEWDGPVRREYPRDPAEWGAMIECPRGVPGDDEAIEAVIARQREFFAARGQRVEWKTYAQDVPGDLVARLARHGFVPGEPEALMLGEAVTLTGDVPLPADVRIRRIAGAADWARVAELMAAVWGAEFAHTSEHLRAEQDSDPGALIPVVAETAATGTVLAYALLRLVPGIEFAGLWGGTTHPEHRGRGLYRALTAHRARIALRRGVPYVRVDASPDSRPILTRLGLHEATTTTPCVLDPRPG